MTQYTLNIKPYSITCAYAADSAPQTITASSASTDAAGELHIVKAVSAHLNTPSSLNLKKLSPVAYRTQLMQTA